MRTFCIFLGGRLTVTDRLRMQIKDCRFIAADSGIRHAKALDVKPELWVGDFDSTEPSYLKEFSDCPQQAYPVDKDATDGELAVNAAIACGAKKLILCGAFGGERPDHTLFHMVYAISLQKMNFDILLTSGDIEGYPLNTTEENGLGQENYQQHFNLPPQTFFSIIGFDSIQGLTIENAKWSLQNRDIPFGSSLTLSNETIDKPLKVSLKKGKTLLITYPTNPNT